MPNLKAHCTISKENDVKCIEYHDPAVQNILKSIEEKKYEGLTKEEKAVIDNIN